MKHVTCDMSPDRQFEADLLELGFQAAKASYVQEDAGWMLGMYFAAVLLANRVPVERVFGNAA